MRRQPFPAAHVVAVATAKACIARALLQSPNDFAAQLGSVTLLRYQLDGVARLRHILARHRGALLADEVGLGKTYTALGVARHFASVAIVAPAALRSMWHDACARCNVTASFFSAEALSRSAPAEGASELVLVDEAHWFRNPTTKRYRRLAQHCRAAAVLLLSATPLHNRPADLTALFALFLGVRAARLSPNDIAELTVRRGRQNTAQELSLAPPAVRPTCWWRVASDARVLATLEALAAPVPPRDGGLALALLRLTLVRRLSSSNAALRATLRRMLARALALLDAAHGGSYPTGRELCAWVVADEAVQLALPGLTPTLPNEALSLEAVERHIASVRTAIAALDTARNHDSKRAAALIALLRRFPTARIVAFSQYDATVRALARELRGIPGIAVLSGKGARIASGKISRSALLRQFDAGQPTTVHRALEVRLLLTTDLLSEGVNLHNAQVVVHLDVPWTSARLEQRVGRVSRMGSPHDEIHVYGFAPSVALEQSQRMVARLRAKWELARRHLGESALLAGDALVTQSQPGRNGGALARDQEDLHGLLTNWIGDCASEAPTPFVAHVHATTSLGPMGIALLRLPHGHRLVAFEDGKRMSMHPRVVLRVAKHLDRVSEAMPTNEGTVSRTRLRVERFMARMRGSDAVAGALGSTVAVLHARIASATKVVARGRRPRALELAAAIRGVLQRVRSAGDHALLGERIAALLDHTRHEDPLAWLERAHVALRTSFPARNTHQIQEQPPYRVIGILMGT